MDTNSLSSHCPPTLPRAWKIRFLYGLSVLVGGFLCIVSFCTEAVTLLSPQFYREESQY